MLSLAGEVLLLAVDPARGGLLPRRGELRRALTAARVMEGGGERGALRAARRELLGAGLVETTGVRRTLRLVDRRATGKRFRRLLDCLEAGEFPEQRDKDLLMLLAVGGVLNARLTTYQRSLASRRLRVAAADWSAPYSGHAGMSEGVGALGAVAGLDLAGLVGDSLGLLDSGSGSDGGFDGSDAFGGHDTPG